MYKIALVDVCTKRRARLVSAGAKLSIHVEPFDHLAELMQFRPAVSGVLIYDSEDFVFDEILSELDRGYHVVPVASFTETPVLSRAIGAVQAGLSDYLVEWQADADLLEQAVTAFDRSASAIKDKKLRSAARQLVDRLSAREAQVMEQVLAGETSKEMAYKLNISPRTVEIHRSNMLRKLRARGTADVVRIGLRAGRGVNLPEYLLERLSETPEPELLA